MDLATLRVLVAGLSIRAVYEWCLLVFILENHIIHQLDLIFGFLKIGDTYRYSLSHFK